jgi:hypothetical protein
MNTVLTTLCDNKIIVHFEFIPKGQTVNPASYVEIWKRLHEAASRKRWGLNFGPPIGFYIMTVLQLTALSISFWPKNQLLKWNIHPIPLT